MKFFNKKIALLSLLSLRKFTYADNIRYKASSIDTGVILHAFTWSFNTIRGLLPDIQKAGYTAIQTSPIANCYTDGNYTSDRWYWPYQPVSYDIGNYMVGSEDEFKSLCSEAKQYGIKIIVDAVLNHMTYYDEYIEYPFNLQRNLHPCNRKLNEGCRNEITQMELLGLKDVNTQSKEMQNLALDFLKRAVADGAAGFRYDAAKHIELPDDRDVGSDYWTVVLNNGAEFQYGETLQTNVSREKDYAKIMKVTASNYGFTLREAVTQNDFSIGRIADYNIPVTNDRLITWVESHDNYSNETKESTSVTNEEITLAWALLASRKDTTPLFFTRPRGGGGKNKQFPDDTYVCEEGDPLYKSKTITEINIFRNSMEGEMENLRNINNEKIIMIERGHRGAVIINLNSFQINIESETLLMDDFYNDHISGNLFTVMNGKITGNLLPRSVTVLYNSNASETDPFISIENYPTVSENKFRGKYLDVTLIARNLSKSTYSINGQNDIEFQNSKVLRIGEGMSNGVINILLRGLSEDGQYVSAYYTFTKTDPDTKITVYFQCENYKWGDCRNIYLYTWCLDPDNKTYGVISEWPGIKMNGIGNGIFKTELPGPYDGPSTPMSNKCFGIFNNNNGKQVPLPKREGYTFIDGGIYGDDNYYGQYEFLHGPEKQKTTTIILPETTPWVIPTTTSTASATTTTTIIIPTTTENVNFPSTTEEVQVTETTLIPTSTVTSIETFITEPTPLPYYTIFFEKPNYWNENIKAYTYYSQGKTVREGVRWPGEGMIKESNTNNIYSVKVDKSMNRIIFNDGNNQVPGSGQEGFNIKDFALYNINGYVRQYKNECHNGSTTTTTNTVTIHYYSNWNPTYIHYQYGNKPWTIAPGIPMNSYSSGYQKIEIDIETFTSLTFVFNDGRGNWDNNQGRNYHIDSPGIFQIKNGNIESIIDRCI